MSLINEVIYEGEGEVIPLENTSGKIIISTQNRDENRWQLFNCDMKDEDIVESIFSACDIDQTGLVNASVLVGFLQRTCGEEDNNRNLFNNLLGMLDPKEQDQLVDIVTFQHILQCWITGMSVKQNSPENVSINDSVELPENDQECIKENSSLISDSHSDSSKHVDIAELQYQNTKLCEENRKLHSQITDIDENNTRLQSEYKDMKLKITNLESKLRDVESELQHYREENGILQNDLLRTKEDFHKLTTKYQACDMELQKKIQDHESLYQLYNENKEHGKNLTVLIQKLEEVIISKEAELEDKEKQIEELSRISASKRFQEEIPYLSPKNDYLVHPVGNLEDSLHLTEFQAHNKFLLKSTTMPKPEYLSPIVWNEMLNEPEYEEQDAYNDSSPVVGERPGREQPYDLMQQNGMQQNVNLAIPDEREIPQGYNATPIVFKSEHTNNGVRTPVRENLSKRDSEPGASIVMDFLRISKRLHKILLYSCLFLFAILMVITWSSLAFSIMAYQGCVAYHSLAYYNFHSLGFFVQFLEPYCRLQYFGSPPV